MSKVELVNRALTLLGANRITNLIDGTEETKVINAMYEGSLRSMLSETLWGFATARAVLVEQDVQLPFGDERVYSLPSDMVRIFWTNLDDMEIPYNIEGDTLVTKAKGVCIKYTKVINDDNKFPQYFREAFVYRLASDICYDLTNNPNRFSELLQMYEGHYLPIALNCNARDNSMKQVKDDHWVNSVYGARWG